MNIKDIIRCNNLPLNVVIQNILLTIRFDCQWMNFGDIFDNINPKDEFIQYTSYGDQMKYSENISKWNKDRIIDHKSTTDYLYDHIKINFSNCFTRLYETGEMLVIVDDLSIDIDEHIDIIMNLLSDYNPQILKVAILKIRFRIKFKTINKDIINDAKQIQDITFRLVDDEIFGEVKEFSKINSFYEFIKNDIVFPDTPNINFYVTI